MLSDLVLIWGISFSSKIPIRANQGFDNVLSLDIRLKYSYCDLNYDIKYNYATKKKL